MRKLLAATVLTLVTLGVAAPAAAGGWAVTTLDPLAAAPVAGEPFDVGFTIRQHGQTPVSVTNASIIVTNATGAETHFAAAPAGAIGHHTATVTIPADGTYTWAVDQGLGIQDLGTLRVGTGKIGTGSESDGSSPWTLPLLVAAVALGGLGVADIARGTLARRRPQPA